MRLARTLIGVPTMCRHKVLAVSAISACLIGLAFAQTASFGASRSEGQSNAPAWALEVPLQKLLPVRQFAVLDRGVVRKDRWEAFTFQDPRDEARVCLDLITLHWQSRKVRLYSVKQSVSCGEVEGFAGAPPVLESSYSYQGGGAGQRVGDTVIAVGVPESATSINFHLAGGVDALRAAGRLSAAQVTKAKVQPYRFGVLSVAQASCLTQVEASDRNTNVVMETPYRRCR